VGSEPVSISAATGTAIKQAVDPLATLSSERVRLEHASDFWSGVLVVATVVVAVGVVLEFAEDVPEVVQALRAGERPSLKKLAVWLGAILVILGVSAEFAAEMRASAAEGLLRTNAAAAQGVLTRRADAATAQAVEAVNAEGGLDQYVRSNADRINRDLGDLERAKVTAEKALAPRHLTGSQINGIAGAIRQFPGTPFNLAMHEDVEAIRFLDEVEAALESGGWKEVPPDIRGSSFNRGNKPPVGTRTMSGVWILSAPEFEKPRHALVLALRSAGVATLEHNIIGSEPEDHRGVAVWVGQKP
jgi:hypothetical protein